MCQLKKLRTKKRITQIELSESIHIPKPYIAMWENNKTVPNNIYSEKLAEYFHVTVDEFLK